MSENIKRMVDYREGAKSAIATMQDKGYEWTRQYCDSKIALQDNTTMIRVIAYWQGYNDKLIESKSNGVAVLCDKLIELNKYALGLDNDSLLEITSQIRYQVSNLLNK